MDEFYESEFMKEVLKFEAELDLDKLTAAGHSMGGISALKAAENDPRI